jgi:hypothetical protein
MNRDEIQRILVAIKERNDAKVALLEARNAALQAWKDAQAACCEESNTNWEEIIDELTEWAAIYSATYTDYLCQIQDDEDISYAIVFDNYFCQQEDVTTTTTTTAAPVTTTSTTIDPDLVQYEIVFSNYSCMQEDDPNVPDDPPLKSGEATWEAVYTDYLCALENDPLVTTTTTTFSGTTTTSTTVDPDEVSFLGEYTDYLCKQVNNPLVTTTTTTGNIDASDVEYEIVFSNYICMQTDVTTTTTTAGPTTTTTTGPTTTTTTAPITTTTTTTSLPCGDEITGGYAYPATYAIDLGATLGQVTLNIDTTSSPDKFIVEFDGAEVINTGYRGDTDFQSILYDALAAEGDSGESIIGPATGTFVFDKTTATEVAVVRVYAPIDETEWSFTLSCPDPVTTTTTTGTEAFTATYTDYLCQLEDDGITTTTTSTTVAPVVTTTTTADLVPEYEVSCGAGVNTGTQTFPSVYVVIGLGSGVGNVVLTYDAKEIPDKFIVEIDGLEVINTGYRGSTDLQDDLDTALAAYGLPSETIVSGGSGTESFYKTTSTEIAIVKVWAPMAETEWNFSLACPDGSTTTTTSPPVTTTTTTGPTTTTSTTATPTTTTTTTNAAPVSSANSVENSRATCGQTVTLVPADFTFTDPDGDDLDKVQIVTYSLSGSGTLKYDGKTVTPNKKIQVYGGATGSFLYNLVYTPDPALDSAYSDTITFLVKTDNNPNYG